MKILAVCRSGNVRSITLARLLRKRGHEAIGVGTKATTLLPILADWAEVIYPMDLDISAALMKTPWEHKVRATYLIGPDDWKIPEHPDLLRRLRDLVEANPPT